METNNQLNSANPTQPKPTNYEALYQSNATMVLVLLVLQYWYPLWFLFTGETEAMLWVGIIYITWGLGIFGIGLIYYFVQTVKQWKDLSNANKLSLLLFVVQGIVFAAFLIYLHSLKFI